MRWFRSNKGGAAWLAVFALACQFLLSFGHVHLGKYSGGTYSGGPVAWTVADGRADSGVSPPQSTPPQNAPVSLPDDFCAICVNVGMAGTLVMPAAPVLTTPDSFVVALPWSLAASERAAPGRLPFSARGPPQA